MNMLRDIFSKSGDTVDSEALITLSAYVMLGTAIFLFVLAIFCMKDFVLRGGPSAKGEKSPPFRFSLLVGGIAAFALALGTLYAADTLWACRMPGVSC